MLHCYVSTEVELYHRVFPMHASVIGVRPVRDDEELWHEQIRKIFMYPPANAFAASPTATEGALIPNTRPCRVITPTGEEVVLLSSEESIASSKHGLKSLPDMSTGSLRDLGIDHEEKKPKRVSKKKVVTVAKGAHPIKQEARIAASGAASCKGMARPHQRSLDDFVIVADSMEELYSLGGMPKATMAADARSTGSMSSKGQPSSATSTSILIEKNAGVGPFPGLTGKNASKR
ncbi:hypothetical protein HanPI659440_Chr02g0049921 [Helianthus annuus]|uniref:Uncharacterized protein n=1 Tax=Helianthus annuus TaxID=4232 RepID=A0A9K3JMW5_HELAN|nr:hypothetical protein HanXRQr2_Chr02g0066211 [Helianthus annuus]KAJ0615400.1 hypothetical protein HanIR_Chr02g0073661 [Helianthus annuus]KAJ0618802.1 hypothetical protein HanHA89_Chr02g0057711 [Helianthus annuus]KAJ0805434.1 hypothetical protein HanPI659440_Chr02g0049921 [Helianthus annuus]KAJ0951844.1 hypothetical protein HanPSC8_Chr02g0065161 [Helianthus annuus]